MNFSPVFTPDSASSQAVEKELDAIGIDAAIERLLDGISARAIEFKEPTLNAIIRELRRREIAGRAVLRNARARRKIG